MTENKRKKSRELTRRDFLKDAGLLVGGTAIGSTVLLAACGGGETETVTNTVTNTATVTSTAPGGTITSTTTTTLPGTTSTSTTTATTTQEVSRFVCPSCGMEFDTLVLLQEHTEAEHPVEPAPIILTINGIAHKLYIEPNKTLLDVLRERFGLTGAKRWCDLGECGHCSVILDGKLINSCMVLAIECDGSDISTIEGLAEGEKLHPIQEAFIENMGFQCGTCTPGMIMSAKALLDTSSSPTQQEIQQGLAGVLCKCGNYRKIFQSVAQAAERMGVY